MTKYASTLLLFLQAEKGMGARSYVEGPKGKSGSQHKEIEGSHFSI